MVVLRAFARPLLASIFIVQGYDTFRHPEKVATRAEPVITPLAERFPAVPAKPEDAVRLNGAVQMAAGTMLALGRWPRLSALALAATLVPTTLAGHRFWEAEDDATKAQQRIHFLKNTSMLGGLLIAVGDTEGKPSIAWRARYAAQEAGRTARSARKQAARTARTAKVSAKAGSKAGKVSAKAGSKAGQVSAKAGQVSAKAGKVSAKAGSKAGQVSARANRAAGAANRKAAQLTRSR
jgi:putative oxidoreductase